MLGKQNNCCGGWVKRRASEEGARWEGGARKKKVKNKEQGPRDRLIITVAIAVIIQFNYVESMKQ